MEPEWREAALNGDTWAKKKAAAWTQDPETQLLLAQSGHVEVLFELAKNGVLSNDVLDILLTSSDPFVQMALLHPQRGLSEGQIDGILKQRNQETSSVLAAAAKNPTLPLKKRMDIALGASDSRVLDAVMKTLTADELTTLSTSSNKRVQKAVSKAIVSKSFA